MTTSSIDQKTFDVVVVGNGVLGLSLGLTLARRGLGVALIGEAHRPTAASTAAGAMLGCFGEVTTTLLKSEHGRTKMDFGVRAAKMWDSWLTALDEDAPGEDIRTADGTTVMLNTVGMAAIDDANFTAIRDMLDTYDEPYEDVDPADIEWLDPDPNARPLRAMHIPGEHAVNTPELLDRLQTAFVRRGGTVVDDTAVRLHHQDSRINGVTLASGAQLSSARVVLAGGARTQELLDTMPELSARIPRLVSGYGVSALMRTEGGSGPRSVLRTPNRAFACGLHVLPRGEGEVYVGATNVISPEPVTIPAMGDVLFLLECSARQVRRDLWGSGVHKLQVGNRPVSLDGFPLLGEAGVEGLWMMTGTYRDGLHLSPLLAEEMTRRLLGEEHHLDWDAFRPVRSPIAPESREEIVQTVSTHLLATGYEYPWRMPVMYPMLIEAGFQNSFSAWADELDPEFTPPAELLAVSRRLYPVIGKWLREYYAASRSAREV
ncbi:NAD(P)/FAD-dependent oxidoreductase [Streptomyces gilvosporeus]|uniref:NAD(P)/FAD-dependent oxidoreductase n=1 Tax=Streptomyces gilvosporeus TaxID=553510 RepID=UPI00193935D6|nr:FAD-dependent oxidoreductase [Streptomyces gilvosporeus]